MKIKPETEILAWHCVNKTLRDGQPVPDDGVWLHHTGTVEICRAGFHGSIDVWDALGYAPGETLCRVAMRGSVLHRNDKLVARERMIISRMDITHILRLFARQQALSVMHLWNAPKIVREYLETGDESKRAAAREAAWRAAWAAAWEATRAAACTAWAASSRAAREAAWEAAREAAWASGRAEAREAKEKQQRIQFTNFIHECFELDPISE